MKISIVHELSKYNLSDFRPVFGDPSIAVKYVVKECVERLNAKLWEVVPVTELETNDKSVLRFELGFRLYSDSEQTQIIKLLNNINKDAGFNTLVRDSIFQILDILKSDEPSKYFLKSGVNETTETITETEMLPRKPEEKSQMFIKELIDKYKNYGE